MANSNNINSNKLFGGNTDNVGMLHKFGPGNHSTYRPWETWSTNCYEMHAGYNTGETEAVSKIQEPNA
jgi:hypothetical protein